MRTKDGKRKDAAAFCGFHKRHCNPFCSHYPFFVDSGRTVTVFISILDFHAEATSEKQALAFYLDGRVTVLYGTHTHVPTADECILPKGTAYITDVGMCGPQFSVLGIKPECIIEKMTTALPVKFIPSQNPVVAHGVEIEIDRKTKKAVSIRRITF